MDERFPDEFVTWHHKTAVGVKVDEVFGMDNKSGKTWEALARQIYCEQGGDYRVLNHYPDGVPYLEGYPGRISLTHTNHFFAVASLPKTPECDLQNFSPRSAMGIDTEPLGRVQVIKVREKFLSEDEESFIEGDDLQANILAWTSKEALYKAALTPGLDLRNSLIIKKLPSLNSNPIVAAPESIGEAEISFPKETGLGIQAMRLFSYESYGCCVTIAYSPKCARFGK